MNMSPVEMSNANGIYEFNCENSTLSSSAGVEFFGDGSRCIETTQSRPLCMRMVCDAQRKKVVVYANNDPIICENDGDFMDIPGAGGQPSGLPAGAKIQCPILNMAYPK